MANARHPVGTIGWHDLTVEDAPAIRDFYKAVIGWGSTDIDMGGYPDFVMTAPGSAEGVAGVCHARGPNAKLPPQWLAYVIVADVGASIDACSARGGRVISGPTTAGDGSRYCVVQDPAGAVLALMSYPPDDA